MQLIRIVALILCISISQYAHSQSQLLSKNSPLYRVPITIQLLFNTKNLPSNVELYEIPVEKILDVDTHAALDLKKPFPFTTRLASEFKIQRGETKYYSIVIRNNTDKTKYFYSTEHEMNPAESAVGYTLHCVCNSRFYKIPPQTAWYKIASITLTPLFIGNSLAIKHDLFGMSFEEIQKRKAEALMVDK